MRWRLDAASSEKSKYLRIRLMSHKQIFTCSSSRRTQMLSWKNHVLKYLQTRKTFSQSLKISSQEQKQTHHSWYHARWFRCDVTRSRSRISRNHSSRSFIFNRVSSLWTQSTSQSSRYSSDNSHQRIEFWKDRLSSYCVIQIYIWWRYSIVATDQLNDRIFLREHSTRESE
jgi:hypothetical protein